MCCLMYNPFLLFCEQNSIINISYSNWCFGHIYRFILDSYLHKAGISISFQFRCCVRLCTAPSVFWPYRTVLSLKALSDSRSDLVACRGQTLWPVISIMTCLLYSFIGFK